MVVNKRSLLLRNKIKKCKGKDRIEDLTSIQIDEELFKDISKTLTKQIDWENFTKKYATVGNVLKIVGMGVFLTASVTIPNLPLALKPFLNNQRKSEYEAWKRFNIRYLKRALERLEKQKLVEIYEEDGTQIVKITGAGQRKILKFAIDELAIEKPKMWNGKWTLISYDIPNNLKTRREIFQEYLKAWGFYPLHESVYLHAWPCEKQVEFLRQYLGIGEFVRSFIITRIENDKVFRDYFGV
ncbi:hypothetical protein A3B39_02265 [Candidatus Daviesbacteria bacterium RIFCSPLOWO2_01_FULL_37_10]|nr:MAG: hypothetical protein A3B39_02265 [Candidatus Daviesbacteria bacterium RIFCSPLOWO2_01_FULL_37_10]